MPSYTPNLNLIKPAGSEEVDVDQLNTNFDRIDSLNDMVISSNLMTPNTDDTSHRFSITDQYAVLDKKKGWVYFRCQGVYTGDDIVVPNSNNANISDILVARMSDVRFSPYGNMVIMGGSGTSPGIMGVRAGGNMYLQGGQFPQQKLFSSGDPWIVTFTFNNGRV